MTKKNNTTWNNMYRGQSYSIKLCRKARYHQS